MGRKKRSLPFSVAGEHLPGYSACFSLKNFSTVVGTKNANNVFNITLFL